MWANKNPRHLAFRAHDRNVVTCLQFDNDKIVTGSDSGKIHVYDTATGALRCKLEGHGGGVWALEYHGNTLVSGSTDRTLRIWDLENAKCTHVFKGHTSTVRNLQILPPTQMDEDTNIPVGDHDWPLIVSGSRDFTMRVWKLPRPGDQEILENPSQADEECPYLVHVLRGHEHTVRSMAAYGDIVVSGSYDCTVRVWQISSGVCLHRLEGHTYKVYSVALDKKRNRCISGSMDHTVKIWSLETGAMLFNLEGHTSLIGLLELNEDLLVSASADATVRIWDPETGECRNVLSSHTGAITCFQHDGEKVVSGADTALKIWNIQNEVCERDLLTGLSGVWQVRFRENYCVAAVQRAGLTYIEVLDFASPRDDIPSSDWGKRTLVDELGDEVQFE
ncbi:unnamed protein product [Penicillium bialowiezense]